MQTRKRAKSVSFGKKEKKEEEVVTKLEEKVEATESKTSEKAEVVERRTVLDKPQNDELSETLSDSESETSDVESSDEPSKEETKEHEESKAEDETSHDESDSETSTATESDEEKSEESSESSAAEEEHNEPEPVESEEEPQSTETKPEKEVTKEHHSKQSESELSGNLPPSAFTIQSGGATEIAPTSSEPGKKRFGVYFFVVAFLSFILGLGAMAAVSYFGLISLSLPKLSLPASVHVPSFIAAKPTPTSAPKPTTAPTAQPVDLQAYTIDVLNGSGITGQASKYKSSLTTDGFKVDSTGNADNSNFTKTEISAKKSVSQAYISKLEDELKKTLDVDNTVATSPDADSTDVTVTLGSSTSQ